MKDIVEVVKLLAGNWYFYLDFYMDLIVIHKTVNNERYNYCYLSGKPLNMENVSEFIYLIYEKI